VLPADTAHGAPDSVSSAPAPSGLARLFLREDLNFLVTNRIPRRLVTKFMGWFSRIEHPWVRDLSLALWRKFAPDLDLADAKHQTFRSLHDCFTRELRPGARAIDPRVDVITSPCDAVVGAHGRIRDGQVIQTKGFPYTLLDLLGDAQLVERHRHGWFVTLRLRSTMYHRFHAPADCRLTGVNYISGDTWNVNPIALARVERLFCKNERAVLDLQLATGPGHLTLVPVAAIMVAGIRLHCLPEVLDLRYRGPNHIPCDARFAKGQEMGWFQHGSTILAFATGPFALSDHVREGQVIRVGQPLFHMTASP
jgi:phosphatidylserine decarboxylase